MSTGHTRILTESDIGALSQTPSCPVFLLKMPVTHQLRLTRTAEIMFFGKTVTSRRHAIPGTTCGVLNPAVSATAWAGSTPRSVSLDPFCGVRPSRRKGPGCSGEPPRHFLSRVVRLSVALASVPQGWSRLPPAGLQSPLLWLRLALLVEGESYKAWPFPRPAAHHPAPPSTGLSVPFGGLQRVQTGSSLKAGVLTVTVDLTLSH